METVLYIVRHAEAEGNLYQRFHGHTDGAVTENGKKQLELLAEFMEKIPLDKICTSDLSRATETARAVRGKRAIDIIETEELREVFGGKWEDMSFSELEENYPVEFEAWENAPHNCILPCGESIAELQIRAVAEVMRFVRENDGKRLAVVTHGTVIRTLCCNFRALPLARINEVGWVDNASLTKIILHDNGAPTICFEGKNDYLAELSTLQKQAWWRKVGSLISASDIDK